MKEGRVKGNIGGNSSVSVERKEKGRKEKQKT